MAVAEAVEVVIVGGTGRVTCYGFYGFNDGHQVY